MIRMLLWAALVAQDPILRLPSEAPQQHAGPSNLNFEVGEAGQAPTDWSIAQFSRISGYSTELRKQGCRSGSGCAVIIAGPKVEKRSEGAIVQQFPAEEYEGQRMRLRAWVKLAGGKKGDRIKVAFTADGEDVEATHTQKGRGVEAAEWTLAEVEGKVPWHAETIHIVISTTSTGTAWIDDVSFEPAR
jgi:hypothetical protein